MILTLPWPPSILRPNDRSHWAKKNPHKAKYRSDCYFLTKAANKKTYTGCVLLNPHITFYPPNNRWDWDAMISAAKAGFDGVAEALGVDDKYFRPTVVFEAADTINPRVEIRL